MKPNQKVILITDTNSGVGKCQSVLTFGVKYCDEDFERRVREYYQI